MADRIGSSRRLIIIAAALLTAVAITVVLGVIPPLRSGTSPHAAPPSAWKAYLVHAIFAGLAALALGRVAARAVDHARSSIGNLYVIGAVVFLLVVVFAGPAPAFLARGPSLYLAVLFMFLSGAAELAACGLVLAAASRLSGPATLGDVSAWKLRVTPAALLGFGALFLSFFLGEGIKLPANVPAAEYVGWLILAVVLGGYSLLATFVVSRGLPQGRRNLWIAFAMNVALLLSALISLLAESSKSEGLQALGLAITSSAFSYGGLVLATRTARPPVAFDGLAGH